MATSITFDVQGFENLLKCSVCSETFNDEGRKPKFLSCHHTLCLKCAKAMTSQLMVVMCPVCRKETRLNANDRFELPNNQYILEMITGSKASSNPIAPLGSPQPVKERWCMKCRKEASNLCSILSGHSIISIGEYYSESHCLELQKIMDNNESQLRNVVEKRMEAKTYYNLAYTALKVIENEVKKLEENNELRVLEILSLLNRAESVTEKQINIQSLAMKVQEETETVKMQLKDFLLLEESFVSIIREIKMPVQSMNGGGVTTSSPIPRFGEETKMNISIASEILLTLIKSSAVKSHEIPAPSPKPNTKPKPKPKPKGLLRWIDGTS